MHKEKLYEQSLEKISAYFYKLESKIKRPEKIRYEDFYVYRYTDKNIFEAMVLKSARVVTTLKAIYMLNKIGFLQEQASLQRVHDELTEDVLFLGYAVMFDKITEKHTRFLDAFFQEEVCIQKKKEFRPKSTLPRKKIRAYINSFDEDDPSSGIKAGQEISHGYSGYVHGASNHIMELYYGNPPYFHISGMRDSPFYEDHYEDLLNYFYRSILNFAFVAKALGDEQLFSDIHAYSKEFAISSGEPERLSNFV